MSQSKVCLITGASRGIGQATARALQAAGWRLALAGRSAAALEETQAQLGGSPEIYRCDVGDEEAVRRTFAGAVEHFGRLDALVCAAGVGAFAPTTESTLEEWEAQVRINLTGTYLTCREALKVMLPRRSGHLVTILSVASKVAFPGSAAYCASKWGAYGLTKSLAEEVRRDGVRVTAILPGSTDTPFWDAIGGPPRADMLPADRVADAVRYALEAPPDASIDEICVMPPKGIL